MKQEINHRKRNEKKIITRRINNMLLRNEWVNAEIKNILKTLRQMTMKIQPYRIHGMQQEQFLEENS